MSHESDHKSPAKMSAKDKRKQQQKDTQARLIERIRDTARDENGIDDLSNDNVRVPLTALDVNFNKLLGNAKKRYYKRTKKNTPFKTRVLQRAKNDGINEKYVKFSRELTSENAVLNAARTRKRESNEKASKRKNKAKVSSKAKREANKASKEVTQLGLKVAIMQALRNEGYNDVKNDDPIVPLKATQSNYQKLLDHARKRYLKRTKKHNQTQRNIVNRIVQAGVPKEYVKFRKEHKTFDQLLDAARERMKKATKKQDKPIKKQSILDYARDTLGIDSKEVRTLICAKEKK